MLQLDGCFKRTITGIQLQGVLYASRLPLIVRVGNFDGVVGALRKFSTAFSFVIIAIISSCKVRNKVFLRKVHRCYFNYSVGNLFPGILINDCNSERRLDIFTSLYCRYGGWDCGTRSSAFFNSISMLVGKFGTASCSGVYQRNGSLGNKIYLCYSLSLRKAEIKVKVEANQRNLWNCILPLSSIILGHLSV